MLLGFEIGQRWPEAVMHSCGSYFVHVPKGSLKNKFTFSGVEAPAWQGARRTNSRGYLTNEQRSHAGWIGSSKYEVIFERALRNDC